MKKERVAVFVDGSNFYHKLTNPKIGIKHSALFNYRGFAEWLARGREIVYCGYYVGAVRAKQGDAKGQKLRRNQQRLFSHLTSDSQQFTVKRGFMMKNDGIFHEKGVDVHLATDLLVGGYENGWDTAIIISSDTDLIPAISKIRELKKCVEYIGFSFMPSFGLQKYSTLSRLLIKDDLLPFESTK